MNLVLKLICFKRHCSKTAKGNGDNRSLLTYNSHNNGQVFLETMVSDLSK